MTLLDYTDTPFARRPRLHRKPSLEGPSSAGFGRRNLVGMMGVMMASGAKNLTARDYVQDGLVAMWDGIENAGFGVHDASATVWKDLISSYHLTLDSSGISFGENCIILNGGRATSPSFVTQKILQLEIVSSHSSQGLLGQFGQNTANRQVFVYPAGTFNFSQSSANCSVSVSTNSVHSVSATYNDSSSGDVGVAYVDGANAVLGGRKGNMGFGGLMIGGATETYMVIKGAIYSIRLYSRALSSAEIAANYAVDKARFGL